MGSPGSDDARREAAWGRKYGRVATVLAALALAIPACDGSDDEPPAPQTATGDKDVTQKAEADHAHDEVPLGTFEIGGMKVETAQAHGTVEAGKEGHLVIKLPYKDNGSAVVRAWIGTADRTLSTVGKGEYAPSHDDYDIHAVAPSPLPADAQWWVEIEKSDGAKAVGSFPFLKQPVNQ